MLYVSDPHRNCIQSGAVAQMVERLLRMQEVWGSMPHCSNQIFFANPTPLRRSLKPWLHPPFVFECNGAIIHEVILQTGESGVQDNPGFRELN